MLHGLPELRGAHPPKVSLSIFEGDHYEAMFLEKEGLRVAPRDRKEHERERYIESRGRVVLESISSTYHA